MIFSSLGYGFPSYALSRAHPGAAFLEVGPLYMTHKFDFPPGLIICYDNVRQ